MKTHTLECRICIRVRTGSDGLCDSCRAFSGVRAARTALEEHMTSDAIDALIAYLKAREEYENG